MQKQNIFLLHGENTFASLEKLNLWKLGFKKKYGEEGIIETLDAKDIVLKNFLTDFKSLPFLCEKKMYIIKGAFKAKLEMAEHIEKTPDFTILIFFEDKKADKRSKLYKTLKKIASVEEFEPFDKFASVKYLENYAKKENILVSYSTLNFLIDHCGVDMWKLKNEINKLSLLKAKKEITKEDIKNFTKQSLESSIFNFLDSFSQKNIKKVIQGFQLLLDSGEEINMIFHMIVRQIRLLLQIKTLLSEGIHDKEIISKLKLHPFVVKKTISQSRHFEISKLKEIFEKLLQIDIGIKSGKIKISTKNTTELKLEIEKILIETVS